LFSDINISQGSVATRLRCGGIFRYHFTANLSLSLTTTEFWKSVKIWQSYRHEFGGPVFLEHSVVTGSIARSATRRYLSYSEPILRFFVLRFFTPQGRHVAPMGIQFGLLAKFHVNVFNDKGTW